MAGSITPAPPTLAPDSATPGDDIESLSRGGGGPPQIPAPATVEEVFDRNYYKDKIWMRMAACFALVQILFFVVLFLFATNDPLASSFEIFYGNLVWLLFTQPSVCFILIYAGLTTSVTQYLSSALGYVFLIVLALYGLVPSWIPLIAGAVCKSDELAASCSVFTSSWYILNPILFFAAMVLNLFPWGAVFARMRSG